MKIRLLHQSVKKTWLKRRLCLREDNTVVLIFKFYKCTSDKYTRNHNARKNRDKQYSSVGVVTWCVVRIKSLIYASDSPLGAPAVDPVAVDTAFSSSPSKVGTIKLSLVMSLYLVTKTVKRRHKWVSASKVSKICR